MKKTHERPVAGFEAVLIGFLLILAPFNIHAQSIAEWQTTMGMFRCELREDLVPITANNFIDLANADFYDGVIFHRVIDDFVIQDGDPTGTGSGGPGYTIDDEFHPDLRHDDAGILSMANAGPNTGGSQYFITLTPQPHLDDQHAVFGEVVNGIDVVQAIGDVPTDNSDRPIVDVVIDSITILGIVYPHLELDQIVIGDDPANSDGDGSVNPLESGQLTLHLSNWVGWQDAEDIVATLECDDQRVSIVNGELDLGTLAGGDSTSIVSDPFRFDILANEAFSAILHIQITANPLADIPYLLDRDVDLLVSLNQAGWPLTMSVSASPLIADIDGNGSNEVVFGDFQGEVHAITENGVTELPGFPADIGGSIRNSVAVADVNGDEVLDIIVTKRDGHEIVAIDGNGDDLFGFESDEYLLANPIVVDVDGNGAMEVIAVSMTTGRVFVLNSDGSNFGTFPIPIGHEVRSSPAVGDLDGDGHLEIVVVSNAEGGAVHAISTATAVELSGWPYISGSRSVKGPIIADIDADGHPNVLVGFDSGRVAAIANDGSETFVKEVGSAIKTSIVTGNLDQDGKTEMVFISDDGFLHVLNEQGDDFDGFPVDIGAGTESTPVLADLNGNGTVDVIFGDEDGYLQLIDIDGSSFPIFPLDLHRNLRYGAALGDLDQDSDIEIVISDGAFLHVIDCKEDGEIVWPCLKGNAARTGNTRDIPTHIDDPRIEIVKPVHTVLGGTYPNPSGRETTVRFSITTRDIVRLAIHDLGGREVRTLINGPLAAGEYTLVWDGADNLGRGVASGTYLCRMATGGFSSARRVLIVR